MIEKEKEIISEEQDSSFTKVFELTEDGFNRIQYEINKMMKRKKAKIELEIVGHDYKKINEQDNIIVKIIKFRFSEKYFQLGKWEVIGFKESIGKSVVIHSVGQENRKFPEIVWSHDFTCFGCHQKRHRVKLFVIQNKETGEILQMGSKCLESFVGMSLSQLAVFLEYKEQIQNKIDHELDLLGDIDWDDMPQRTLKHLRYAYIDTIKFLALCYRDTKERGYLSRNEADYQSYEQGHIVESTLERAYNNFRELESLKEPLSEEELAFAEKARDYYLSLDDEKEFTKNAQNILREEFLAKKSLSYVAFIPNTYLKHLEYEAKKANRIEFKNETIGKIGDKIDIKAKIHAIHSFEQEIPSKCYYGTPMTKLMLFITFLDADNHKLVWKTGSDKAFKLEAGMEVQLKGTIKDYSEFNNVKETQLTRCKVIVIEN